MVNVLELGNIFSVFVGPLGYNVSFYSQVRNITRTAFYNYKFCPGVTIVF